MSSLLFLQEIAHRVDDALNQLLPSEEADPKRLHAAMRYSSFAGGKRIRPALVVLGAECCGADRARVWNAAAAMEMIHCFSLIHDDLPALDDDDLRRGRPSLHRKFDEATAILAGDALLNLAIEVLARHPESLPDAGRLSNVLIATSAIGTGGMIGGQMADIEGERGEREINEGEQLERIHRRKTGALLEASLAIGGICAQADEGRITSLRALGQSLGLLFQIRDDLLDVEGSAEQIGKTPGKDRRTAKLTYPALYGVNETRSRMISEAEHSRKLVRELPESSARVHLLELVEYLVRRDH